MRKIDRVVSDYSRVVQAKDARIKELEAEVARLRGVLEDIADGMGEMSHAEIGRFAPAVARAALKGETTLPAPPA